ncbi:protease modulator HflK [Salmonella enterica]|nr:protease modulator HflK [Salmonella enterica]ECI8011986.1 protease modulator HflK [Salmonella enterica subsp. enterica]HEC8150750.1 protease modulator HflK [Salmonella enterica subsp. enterica serovar Mississippi]EJU7420738.1 protease modulator HflK [Salmonella enterica]HEC8217618.1 protease modulator HflK [Salmonella enterica subsp. enterica serovar Mississippi]
MLTFAVILNLGFSLPSDIQVQANETPATPLSNTVFRKFTLPPLLRLWTKHIGQIALTTCCAAIAIYLASANINTATEPSTALSNVIPVGSMLLAMSFALLVCERKLSYRPIRYWSLQGVSVGLLRKLLSILLLVTASLALFSYIPWLAIWVRKIASVLVLLVAIEVGIRSLAALFIIPATDKSSPFIPRSLLAEQYQWPIHPLQLMRRKIFQHFGVDVSKIQAFRLIGKIFVPVVMAVIVVGWLVSGLNQVALDNRGVYERFGHPVAVLKPGLHVGLPWPFGKVIEVDYGAVHELKLSDAGDVKETLPPNIVDSIEGPAPQDSWRLWDNSHTTDQAQLIASAIGDKQSFQIVNMDIRLIWRIGMNDTDAMKSLYQTEDLPTLLQRVARQVLAQYFASQQLDDLLNEQRSNMPVTLNRHIQQRLDRLDIGVELLYTRVESIHPPAGASNAYHGVQAAQIAANAGIMREKGYAATVTNEAQRKATVAINDAEAVANELQAQANRSQLRYIAEYDAWKINPEAYINERRYQTYSKVLSKTPLLIIDNQASGINEPMLDLRQFSQPSR